MFLGEYIEQETSPAGIFRARCARMPIMTQIKSPVHKFSGIIGIRSHYVFFKVAQRPGARAIRWSRGPIYFMISL